MLLSCIVCRNSCITYGFQITVTITKAPVRKTLALLASFDAVEFFLILITIKVFSFTDFISCEVPDLTKICIRD